MSMFCEDCHTLLKKRKKGREIETYCPRCSKRGGSTASGSGPRPPPQEAMSFDELKKADSSFAAPPEMTENHGKHPSIPYFPHPSVREGQSQFMKDAGDAIGQGKHLLAYAPTGIGKTVAALVPAISESLKSGKAIFFLTSKQSQHHIAIETLKVIKSLFNADIHVVDIISKQAMCPRDIAQEFHAAFNLLCRMSQKSGSCKYFTNSDEGLAEQINSTILHVEELKALAVGQKVCPHKVALKAGASSNVIVCDYNYIFDPDISESILENFGKSLNECIIIVDEAHNLPDRIRNYFTQSLTSNMLNEAISEVPNAQLAHILKETRKELVKLLDAVEPGNEELITSEALLSRIEAIMSQSLVDAMDMDTLIGELQKVGEKRMLKGQTSAAAGVSEFLRGFRLNLRGLIRIVSQKDGSRLYFRLLDPSVISAPVFAEFHSSIVMSGTLFPTRMYADLLGIPEEASILRSYKSPFPEENRPIYAADDVTTLYKERSEAMYNRIARHIGDACKVIPGNVAVFFPSYGMLKNIRFLIETDKEIIAESQASTKAQKRQVLETLIDLKSGWGGLLLGVMGGSLSEGIDYKDNLLDSVMIVGIPFAPPSLEQTELIKYYDRKFGQGNGRAYGYTSPAINRVLQSLGRCIRSETDRAVVVLLDKRFTYSMYRKFFPEDIIMRDASYLEDEMKSFYGK